FVQEHHRDFWLRDFLNSSSSVQAMTLLRSAMSANATGNHEKAESDARAAVKAFSDAGNMPGAAQSRLETIYALHRQSKGRPCLNEVQILDSAIKAQRYTWVET